MLLIIILAKRRINGSTPDPKAAKQSQTIMLPPLCFTSIMMVRTIQNMSKSSVSVLSDLTGQAVIRPHGG